ncbi:hypothetical protein K504DRAFT_530374 [Pleomassaria siparia CBS 279.74]|uniref:Fucose-specific lectin n=1 Tax=Pleomassaria siparia CBS 279.74 TaxID=1314801 RepID=A0A6G1KL80_9PLEO|nr:hypothetical protein K504DRAFT_530374 [Pleomassaria siparia CBS 279.74]
MDTISTEKPPPLHNAIKKTDGPMTESSTLSPRPWWRRYWIVLLGMACLVIFGIIFGAVYGVKHASQKNSTTLSPQVQFINQSRSSATPTSVGTSFNSTSAPRPRPRPTPTPTLTLTPLPSTMTSLLPPAESKVPRHIGAAAGASSPLVMWDLRDNGRLWALEYGGYWQEYTSGRFLVAPVTIATKDEVLRMAFSIDAYSGHIVYMFFADGHWKQDTWHELVTDFQFKARPTVVGRSTNKVDVFNIDTEGRAFTVSYDGSSWGEWIEIASGLVGDLSATSWDEDRIDVFGKYGNNNHILHGWWTPADGWTKEFEDLGDAASDYWQTEPDTGSPLAVSWRTSAGDSVIDVFMSEQSTYHKLYTNGVWVNWEIMSASHEGYEFPDTQSLVIGDLEPEGSPLAHLISRGTDNCIHYSQFNGTQWGSWDFLWCGDYTSEDEYPTQYMPTFAVKRSNGKVDFVATDLEGDFILYEAPKPPQPPDEVRWSNDNWEKLGHGA